MFTKLNKIGDLVVLVRKSDADGAEAKWLHVSYACTIAHSCGTKRTAVPICRTVQNVYFSFSYTKKKN